MLASSVRCHLLAVISVHVSPHGEIDESHNYLQIKVIITIDIDLGVVSIIHLMNKNISKQYLAVSYFHYLSSKTIILSYFVNLIFNQCEYFILIYYKILTMLHVTLPIP